MRVQIRINYTSINYFLFKKQLLQQMSAHLHKLKRNKQGNKQTVSNMEGWIKGKLNISM